MAEDTAHNPTPPDAAPKVKPRQHWLLATNQLNLMYMLAAGLVTGPRGFGHRYYPDSLATAPGWIPLFHERIPAGALEQATAEGEHLKAVAASLDLSALRGPVRVLDAFDRVREVQWPDETDGREQALFVPAPLPTSWLESILFPTKELRDEVREDAKEYDNVPLADFKQAVKAKAFQPRMRPIWPPPQIELPNLDASPHHVDAVGAAQAYLTGLGNRGNALIEAARRLADPHGQQEDEVGDSLLRGILRWAYGGDSHPEQAAHKSTLAFQTQGLSRILDAIVRARNDADREDAGQPIPDTRRAVLNTLQAERLRVIDPSWRKTLDGLIQELNGLLTGRGAALAELLARHTGPFWRGILLFFASQRGQDLLELARGQSLLIDRDLVVAAALYGARDGWIGIPDALRAIPGLSAATTCRMAALAQSRQRPGVSLGAPPTRVRVLRELLLDGGDAWSKRQHEAALELARAMRWEELLKTRISLGKGEYRLQVDARGVHLLLDGDVKAVRTDVDREQLLRRLAKAEIPAKTDAKVRAMLGG